MENNLWVEKLLKDAGRMTKKRIIKEDGRYLIYYSFGEACEDSPGLSARNDMPSERGSGRDV